MRAALVLALAFPLAAQTPGAPSALDPSRLLTQHETIRGASPKLLAERGRIMLLKGDQAKGEEALKTSLVLGPTNGEVHRLVALAWLSAGQSERAFTQYDQMLTAAPRADDAIAHAAVDLAQAGFPERADAMMEVSYKLDPGDWTELMHFGVAAAEAKQTALAVKWFGRMKGMDKSDGVQDAWPRAQYLLGQGRVEEGAALVDQILKVRSRDWEFAVAVVRAAILAGNRPLAETWAAKAVACDDSQPELLVELALLGQGKVMPYRR